MASEPHKLFEVAPLFLAHGCEPFDTFNPYQFEDCKLQRLEALQFVKGVALSFRR